MLSPSPLSYPRSSDFRVRCPSIFPLSPPPRFATTNKHCFLAPGPLVPDHPNLYSFAFFSASPLHLPLPNITAISFFSPHHAASECPDFTQFRQIDRATSNRRCDPLPALLVYSPQRLHVFAEPQAAFVSLSDVLIVSLITPLLLSAALPPVPRAPILLPPLPAAVSKTPWSRLKHFCFCNGLTKAVASTGKERPSWMVRCGRERASERESANSCLCAQVDGQCTGVYTDIPSASTRTDGQDLAQS